MFLWPRKGEYLLLQRAATQMRSNKKADVMEFPKDFHHVGLLVNEPSSLAGVPFI
jgi:hypothetical protein